MPNHRLVFTFLAALLVTFAGDASAAEWRADPAASRLTFIGTQAGSPFEGSVETFSATIRFDESDLPASKAVVSIDMASVRTGNAQRDDAVKGQDWFAVATYPKAQFETKAFRHVGENRYEADAVLTIRDVAKPVVLPFALTNVGDATRATGDLVINRTVFGVGQGQWASAQLVAHEVTIRFDLLARPAR
jgi:polyisoprenoid-binding protein YceI